MSAQPLCLCVWHLASIRSFKKSRSNLTFAGTPARVPCVPSCWLCWSYDPHVGTLVASASRLSVRLHPALTHTSQCTLISLTSAPFECTLHSLNTLHSPCTHLHIPAHPLLSLDRTLHSLTHLLSSAHSHSSTLHALTHLLHLHTLHSCALPPIRSVPLSVPTPAHCTLRSPSMRRPPIHSNTHSPSLSHTHTHTLGTLSRAPLSHAHIHILGTLSRLLHEHVLVLLAGGAVDHFCSVHC